jgi:sialidase-1
MASLYKHQYLKNGKKQSVLLFVNPNSTVSRNHITLKASFDDGNTWPPDKYILLDELNGAGYSCMTSIDNDTIGIIFEGSQAQLIFQKINLKQIIQ